MIDLEKIDNPTEKAIQFALLYGTIDGGHHKMWVIDQMLRALTLCPIVTKESTDCYGKPYVFQTQGESEAYKKLIEELKQEDFIWNIGIAP
jgi:hypothetical protein